MIKEPGEPLASHIFWDMLPENQIHLDTPETEAIKARGDKATVLGHIQQTVRAKVYITPLHTVSVACEQLLQAQLSNTQNSTLSSESSVGRMKVQV